MKITGAEAICQSLKHLGVDLVFGYPGGAIMPTYDALFNVRDELHHVLVRHEQGAIHMAEGYARATGKVGVCIATSGPGATNLITGITDARLDSVPLVCITGQVASHLLGTDAFQESDIVGMTVPITKWSYQITKAEEIPYILAKAFYLANHDRPGPVLIDITKDAQFGELDYEPVNYQAERAFYPTPKLQQAELKQAAELINNAKKPYMLIGHGVMIAQAESQVRQVAELTGIPVASTLLGLSAFPRSHPLYVGMLGMHGNYGPNVMTNEADVILAVGMRFDDRVTGKVDQYAPDAHIIHIEIDYAEIGKIVDTQVGIHADAKQALEALLPLLKPAEHQQWIEQFKQCDKQEFDKVIHEETCPDEGDIKMAEAMHMLSEKTQGQSIVVSDVGQNQMVAARYYGYENTNSHITSGGLGTMGFALPAAIGAQMGAMDKQVIAVSGDGGFQMNIQELAVLQQENVPLKIVIFNNSYLGMVRQWQELFFEERYAYTRMQNPDFIQVAAAYGVTGKRVSERAELSAAMDEFLNHPDAYVLEIVVQEQHNVFPMMPSGHGVADMRLD